MKEIPDLTPIPEPQEHKGRLYSGYFRVVGKDVIIFQHQATKKATRHEDPPHLLAQALLFELVVREGRGVPDPEPDTTD